MKKFLFDQNDFDKKQVAEPPPLFSAEQLALAQAQALAEGRQEGIRETRAAQEEQIAQMLARMIAQTEKLAAAEERREIEKCVDATKLAMRVAHKLLPQFSERFALAEIERVILAAVASRRDEPRIAVTVPAAHFEALKARIDEATLEKGYAGKVILIADDALAPTDCRVEWADGGAERLYERLFSQVENEFAKAIAGMQSVMDAEKKEQ
jgi:flagellar assembly protein FliH